MFSEKTKVSRRDILKGMAASSVAALGAASVMSGCSSGSDDDPAYYYPTQPEPDTTPETIVPGSAFHNCKGRCITKAHVKNGVIKRMTTDERPDTLDNPQLRSCLRCRSYKQRIYSPGRLLYPLVYAPDEPNAERGDLSKFKRVTWEEAAQYIKTKYDKIKADHPNMMGFRPTQSGIEGRYQGGNMFFRVVNEKMGGYKGTWGGGPSVHSGSYIYGLVSLNYASGLQYTPPSMMHSKTIVLWGSNCVHSTGSTNYSWWLTRARENGAKVIYVGPVFNRTAEIADEFIPLKPGSDTALLLALMHVMIKENLVVSEADIRNYVVGFYDDPAGTKTPQLSGMASTVVPAGQSLSAYILGSGEQGTFNDAAFNLTMNSSSTKYKYKETFTSAKSPEWAAPICGISAEKIKELARVIASTGKPCAIRSSLGMQRQPNGVPNCWLLLAMCLITGNWGMNGAGLNLHYFAQASNTVGNIAAGPSAGTNPEAATGSSLVPVALWADAVRAQGDPATNSKWTFDADIMAIDRPIKILYNYCGNSLVNQHQDTFANMELLKDRSKVELIITVDNVMTPSARWSDVVLPGDTHFEREELVSDQNYLLYLGKAINPMGEIKSTDEIAYTIGKAFGMEKWEVNTDEKTFSQRIAETWKESANRTMPLDEFKKIGVYEQKKVEVAQSYSGLRANGKVDNTNKVTVSATGYFELYSNKVVDSYVNRTMTGNLHTHINADDEGDPIVLPIPYWVDYHSSYTDLYAGTYDKTTPINISDYPYTVLGQHSIWRVHSIHNPVGYLRELYKKDGSGNPLYDYNTYSTPNWGKHNSTGIYSTYGAGYEPIWMSPTDVSNLGLKNGQLVKVTSAQTRKTLIASIYETPRCLPGVMVIEQGSWFDPVKLKDGSMVDRGGCASTLISEMPSRNDRNNGMMLCQVKIEPFDESQYA